MLTQMPDEVATTIEEAVVIEDLVVALRPRASRAQQAQVRQLVEANA